MSIRDSTRSLLWPAHCLWWLAAPLLAQAPRQQEAELIPLPHPKIAPPVVPAEQASSWLMVMGLVAIVALAALVVWLLFLRKAAEPEESVPPLKRALGRLDALQEELERLTPDELGHRVSVILRDYLQARYGVPAPYRTTQELYGDTAIQAREGLRERFGPVAEFHDRLEFAPQPATQADCVKLIEDARRALRDEKRYASSGTFPPLVPNTPSLPPKVETAVPIRPTEM